MHIYFTFTQIEITNSLAQSLQNWEVEIITHQNRIKMELGNLPQDIAKEIKKNSTIPQIVQLAERILNQGGIEKMHRRY